MTVPSVRHRSGWVLSAAMVGLAMTGQAHAAGTSGAGPLLHWSCDRGLKAIGPGAKPVAGKIVAGRPAGMTTVPGHTGKGVHLAKPTRVQFSLPGLDAYEATVCFWFRPDWTSGNATPHRIVQLGAKPAYEMILTSGYMRHIAPDHVYWRFGKPGNTAFPGTNYFVGNEWRHFAMRWSAAGKTMAILIDGRVVRSTAFKKGDPAPAVPALYLGGDGYGYAQGAYDEVRVYGSALSDEAIRRAAGITVLGPDLMEQAPPGVPAKAPPGTARTRRVSYVEPSTGQRVTHDAAESAPNVYNPDAITDLPVTPHTKWARPLAGGKLRVLVIGDTGYYTYNSILRSAVELWQRLDADVRVAQTPDAALRAQRWDAIVVPSQGWDRTWRRWTDVDPDVRRWVRDRVSTGRTGLVIAHPRGLGSDMERVLGKGKRVSSAGLLRGFPCAAMHVAVVDQPSRNLTAYEWGKHFFADPKRLTEKVVEVYSGPIRAVKLNYKPGPWQPDMGLTPDTTVLEPATDVHYDHWQALAARAVLYAAGRTPVARIDSADVTGKTWTVQVSGRPGGTLWYRARNLWDRRFAEGTVPVAAPGQYKIAGQHLAPRAVVEFILRDAQGRSVDWYAAAVPPATGARFAAIRLERDHYRRGDTVRATVQLADLGERKLSVVAYLCDRQARRLVRTTAPGAAKVALTLPMPRSSDSLLMHVEAHLVDGPRVLDEVRADCPVPHERFDDFYMWMSGMAGNRLTKRHGAQIMARRYGVNGAHRGGGYGFVSAARLNMDSIAYMTHLGYVKDDKYCQTSRDKLEEFLPKNLRGSVEQNRRFRPVFYSLGEEHYCLKGACQSPTCTARFRKHIRAKYGTIDRVNKTWGTTYKSWDELRMLKPEIVDMQKVDRGIVSFENRRFMETMFCMRHAYLARYFRKIDPKGTVGIHCGWDLWMNRGYDYWLLSRGLECFTGYRGPQNQYGRSFFKRSYGFWYHYLFHNPLHARWWPWWALVDGQRAFGWYTMFGQPWAALAADLRPGGDLRYAADTFKTIGGGLGSLLVRTRFLDRDVAIHYSQRSFQAGVFSMTFLHEGLVRLCYDGGVPFHFISYDELGQRLLEKRRTKLLVMPHSISLDPAEVEGVKQYVRGGGVLWADVVPGTYDQFRVKQGKPLLAELFANLAEKKTAEGATYRIGPFGKGTVILADPGNYNYDRNVGRHLPGQSLLDVVAKAAGVRRSATVLAKATGKRPNAVRSSGYVCGRQRYVVVLKDFAVTDRSAVPVTIDAGVTAHRYLVNTGKYLGRGSAVADTVVPSRGKVYAWLPYRVTGLALKPTAPAARGQDLCVSVVLQTDGAVQPDELHVVNVRVTGPNGSPVHSLRRRVVVRGGRAELRLPIAYDDPPGTWHVHATDVTTGAKATLAFRLAR